MAGSPDTEDARSFDEAHAAGRFAGPLLRRLPDDGLDELAADVQGDVDDAGCVFKGEARFVVDPVPRVIEGEAWDAIAAGLVQRVAALERFVADVYGEQRIVAEGVVPGRVVATAAHYDPRLRDVPVRHWLTLAGLDLVRGADGELRVLEDNVRTPSGLAYLLAARDAVTRRVMLPAGARLRDVGGLVGALRSALAATSGAADPHVVLLSDGPGGDAFWEHRTLAEDLGIPLVTRDELREDGDRVVHGERPVDVIYRRTRDERLCFERALRAGTVAFANAFGAGVADDKLAHAYVEDMIRFYLGEEPGLRSVRTYDLCERVVREEVLDRLGELVVKPRAGQGGEGVLIGPRARRDELTAARERVRERPDRWVAQDVVLLSEHPTVVDGELAPRHVDLRPFVIAGRIPHVVPGGLARVALEEGELIVNSSRNGGAKDTWVLG